MTVPRVSVLLLTAGHAAVVERALQSIAAQVLDEAVEVVVADDASPDATPAVVTAWAARVGARRGQAGPPCKTSRGRWSGWPSARREP